MYKKVKKYQFSFKDVHQELRFVTRKLEKMSIKREKECNNIILINFVFQILNSVRTNVNIKIV